MRKVLGSAVWLALAVGAQAQPPALSDDQVSVIALPEPQLRGMLARTVFTTQTMATAAYSLGVPKSCAVVRPAFEAAVRKTLPVWRTNLADAYRQNVPDAVLRRASTEGPALGALTVMPYLSKIGSQMQSKSEPLLRSAAEGVLLPVFEATSKLDVSKIDGEKRMVELRKARDDGTVFCGLLPPSVAR